MTVRPQVLVTRPEPGLGETMAALAVAGWEPVAAPLLALRSLPFPLAARAAGTIQAILLTSGQAVAAVAGLGPMLRNRPVLTVGDATAIRARAAGFADVTSAAGDAASLGRLVSVSLDPADGALLLACGRGQAIPLAQALRRQGFHVIRRCVYAAESAHALPDAALEALQGEVLTAALFFSGETAAAFVRLLPTGLHPALPRLRALAISPAVALALQSLPWCSVEAATMPTATSLLGLLGEPPGR